jgi:hypothetical protein
MAEIDYLAQLAACKVQDTVFVPLVGGGWGERALDFIWENVVNQLDALKKATVVLDDSLDVDFAELCYQQVTGGSVDVLVRFDIRRAAMYTPEHDAILRLYLGQRERRTWHLSKNVASFATLLDPTAPLKDPTHSLFAHLAMQHISKLTQSAAGMALGSAERRAIFAPLLDLVQRRLTSLVDVAGREQMEAVVEDLIDRAA